MSALNATVLASSRVAFSMGRDRWLPGQLVLLPTWWDQRAVAIRPGWVPDPGVGERVPPGRYRVRATWLGREPGPSVPPPEAWSGWFELV